MAKWIPLIACLAHTPLVLAQGTPTSLRPDVLVEHYMDCQSSASRIAWDPVQAALHYIRTNGDVRMVIDNGIDPPYDTLLFTADDHYIDEAYGMAFHDSDLFIVGNRVIQDDQLTQGILHRAHLLPNGDREWSVLAQTDSYFWGGKAHGFNNVVVSPDGQYLYLNCGSRTDHGEVQDVDGLFPGAREDAITAKILRVPINGQNLALPNDVDQLMQYDYLYASGVRNTFDMAFDADGHLFGVENSGDHDDPEEMNWLREGLNYGFPWTAGGNTNPTRLPGYDPVADHLLNPGYPSAATDFYFDATFPPSPWGQTEEPIRNTGPDADRLRDPANGGIVDASDAGLNMSTFTCHRSPLGLVFDKDSLLGADLQGDGFLLSFTPGGDTAGFSVIAPWGIPVVPADPSEDLLHLELQYDQVADNYTLSATRIAEGFYLPVDAELVGNVLYVIENWGNMQRSIWKITMPLASGLAEAPLLPGRQLNVWPVPAREEFFWSTGAVHANTLELMDTSGKRIVNLTSAANHGQLPLNEVQAGAYVVRATFGSGVACQGIVVVK